ncbi:MAG: NAD-dependent protein deacetylase [Woeseiaceae bacterium]|nr:NAD-dependent protein deacetylase [Woeseiaceae bacterium]
MPVDPSALAQFIQDAGRVTVLTGAGVSTASGIPDYRDRDGNWRHPKPVQFADFLRHDRTRRRYWARSFAGWRRVRDARPNRAHLALAELESAGWVQQLITQNVDGLHQRAGHRHVIDLHGRLDEVRCLGCDARLPRDAWQDRLATSNPDWHTMVHELRPDGDADIGAAAERRFIVPGCPACNGIVKPDVVFFGEAVPRERVANATAAVLDSGALLVAGSSLVVFSGFRFARLAADNGLPFAIVNQGGTRAHDLATVTIDGDCGEVLWATAERLGSSPEQAGIAS